METFSLKGLLILRNRNGPNELKQEEKTDFFSTEDIAVAN